MYKLRKLLNSRIITYKSSVQKIAQMYFVYECLLYLPWLIAIELTLLLLFSVDKFGNKNVTKCIENWF